MILPATRVGDKAAVQKLIDGITPDGGTNIETGLQLGFAELSRLPARDGASKRLFLFTDAMPNARNRFRQLPHAYPAVCHRRDWPNSLWRWR
ncbi:MAG: hypothetical protein IPM61_16505 [Chlorobi bacterium]|nr:hypothetical protein [Chlorobiota bacterium]